MDKILVYKENSNNTVFEYNIGESHYDIFWIQIHWCYKTYSMAVFEAESQSPTQKTADIWFAPYKEKDTSECDIEDSLH